jgi:transportin-1
MVYPTETQEEIQLRNELDLQDQQHPQPHDTLRPIFHKSRVKHARDEEEDDDDEEDDDEGNEWTLRKCAAASLDSLATMYGAEPILPVLLPLLEMGLASTDSWIQEASILALGAVADGCALELSAYMAQLHPYLMNHLSTAEGPTVLPQIKVIAAWTIGRYASWAVEQVQTGAQGHLLAHITEVFLVRLKDRNCRVQVAVCSAFEAVIELAGDLMAPYLEPIYQTLVTVLPHYQRRSLLMLFDVFSILADCCGPAIAEEGLPAIYVPPLLRMWDGLAKNDPTDRTLLPLMESLASISVTSGINYQPYALESFQNAMAMIESLTLLLASDDDGFIDNEEDVDPIVCATDLLDGLVEGLGESFSSLVSSSQQYGPQFLNVLLTLCKHDVASVRMSALALVGDLARNAPILIEPALPQILQEAMEGMDPMHPAVSTNAVWAVGEICVRCEHNDKLLRPFAASLMQNLIALLMGNGVGDNDRAANVPGLAENSAACVGRLAKVNPEFVAPELSRFLLGWCDGMAKIMDQTERRDAFQGFVKAMYANPRAIQQVSPGVSTAIASILFSIITWHMPLDRSSQSVALLNGDYNFRPFPQQEAELGDALVKLVQDIKTSVGEEVWHVVQRELPVNVRRLLREAYHIG